MKWSGDTFSLSRAVVFFIFVLHFDIDSLILSYGEENILFEIMRTSISIQTGCERRLDVIRNNACGNRVSTTKTKTMANVHTLHLMNWTGKIDSWDKTLFDIEMKR